MNFFNWDCHTDTTSLGPVNQYFSGMAPGSATLRTTLNGDGVMRLTVVGNDSGNQQLGADVGLNDLGRLLVGGPKVYYRWYMRIEPGFTWGSGTAKTKSSRVGRGPVNAGSAEQGYTGYLMSNGFLIGECSSGGCLVPGGGVNTDSNHLIPFDFTAMADGAFHEYIVAIKANSTVGASDGEFEAYVDGTLVGSASNFLLNTNGTGNHIEMWGGWMVAPYFQLNGTSGNGGTIYLRDFSTDDQWNSLLGGAPGGGGGGGGGGGSGGPWAFVQDAYLPDYDGAARGTWPVAFASNCALGNHILVAVRWGSFGGTDTTVGVTDSLGNSYTQVFKTWSGVNGFGMALFYAENCVAAGPNTVTVSFSPSVSYPRVYIRESSGVAASASLDDWGFSFGEATGAIASPAVTTTGADAMVVGFTFLNGDATISEGAGFTVRELETTVPRFQSQDRNLAVAGSVTSAWTLSAQLIFGTIVAAFKQAAAATGGANTHTTRKRRRRNHKRCGRH